ncbi:MAG: thiol-disulfide oxidoreductase DCC family protein [Maricaulaceae bacterium]
MTDHTPISDNRLVMYHDGACPICAAEVDHYRKADREDRIAFVDASAEAETLSAHGVDPTAALDRLHVRLPNGRIATGARAFVAVWAQLPGWRRIAPIAGAPPFIWLLELGYRLVGPIRKPLAGLFFKPRSQTR